jgi:hypothetical protein
MKMIPSLARAEFVCVSIKRSQRNAANFFNFLFFAFYDPSGLTKMIFSSVYMRFYEAFSE